MKRKLKAVLSVVLCCTLVITSVVSLGLTSAAASVEYFTDASGNKTGIKSVTLDDGTVYYDIADGGILADTTGSVPEFYIKALTADLGGYSTAQIWANVASQIFEEAGGSVGFNQGLMVKGSAYFDTLFTQNTTSSAGDFNLSEVLSSVSEFSAGDNTYINTEYAHSDGLTYYPSLNAVQDEMASELLGATNNSTQTKSDILQGATGSENGFEFLENDDEKPVIAAVATNRVTDPSDGTGLFCYSSFGLAFYDFELVPFSPEGVEFVTAAEGYSTLEEADADNAPGVEYNDASNGSAFVSYTTNPSRSSANVSVSFSETSSVSLSNSMQSTESHTFGTQTGVSASIGVSIPKLFTKVGASISQSFSTQETISTAYGSSKTLTETITNTSTAQVTLPPHTQIGITQQSSEVETVLDYSCPVYITYKVAVFAMNGYGGPNAIGSMGGMCTTFGSASSVNGKTATENLYKRAVQYLDMPSFEKSQSTYLYSNAVDIEEEDIPVDWKSMIDVKQNGGYMTLRECVQWLYKTVPLSAAGAKITMLANGMSTDLTGIEPLYNLDKIVVTSDGTYNLAVGGSLDLATVGTEGKNQYGVSYYGYLPLKGYWTVCDAAGNALESVSGISLDTVSYRQVLTANELGDYYLKFNINETTYKDVNNSDKYITNSDLSVVPIIKISVTQTGENHTCVAGDWKTTIPATCFMEGTQVKCCETCGIQMEVQSLEKLEHTSVKITTPATCTTDGSISEVCGICGANVSSTVIPATGHGATYKKIESEATADHNGIISERCADCDAIISTEEFELHTHEFGYESITREPTCTVNGEKGIFCSICNAMYATQQIEKSGHGATTSAVSVQPTCTQDGEEMLYCTDCGMLTGTNTIPTKGHTEGVWIASVAPTCTQDGEEICICTDCDSIIDARAVEAFGHDDGVWKIDFEATFDHDGQMSRYCSKCDEVLETKEFVLHEHTLGYEEVIKPATCVVDGLKGKFCSICNACYETEAIPATGHGEEITLITIQPTCTSDGEKVTYCADCDMKLKVTVVSATGHDDGVWKVDFEATADHNGQMSRYCSKCAEVLETKEFEKHEHQEGYTKIITPATCTAEGEKGVYCSKCGACYATETIAKKGHGDTYAITTIQPTCISVGEKTVYCSDCHEAVGTQEIEKTGHDNGVWKVDFEATADHDGQMTKYCSICGAALESKTFELHEHTYSSWRTNNDGTHSRDCYKCGFTESANCNYVATVTNPTCTEGGYTTNVCSDCNHTYIDAYADALGHDWSEWSECDADCHERSCERDGCKATESQAHNWSEWEYNEDATLFKNGTKTRSCPDCGATETEEAQHTSWICQVFYPVIVFFGNFVHKIIYLVSLNWLFPELTITPEI